jgi:hypothetical protein
MLLAIDPGNTHSAYCLLNEKYEPVEFAKLENDELLKRILEWQWPIDKYARDPHGAAIEMIASYGMAVGREVFETCVWIGRFEQALRMKKTHVEKVYRQEEKLNLCHSPKANDSNIRAALIDRFAKKDLKNGKGTKAEPDWFYGFHADVWAAYAVGVTALDKRRRGDETRKSV